jgi:hypothetical protein
VITVRRNCAVPKAFLGLLRGGLHKPVQPLTRLEAISARIGAREVIKTRTGLRAHPLLRGPAGVHVQGDGEARDHTGACERRPGDRPVRSTSGRIANADERPLQPSIFNSRRETEEAAS